MIKVGVNGYGTIGKRVADAVALQPDMRLLGVVKARPDFKAKSAISKGYPLFAPDAKARQDFEKAGLHTYGVLEDLLKEIDVVVDATPEGMGERNKKVYAGLGLRAIFEGGEEPSIADSSFVAQVNYDESYGKSFVRCVSCNTTGLCRTLGALDSKFGVSKARAIMIRRAADPDEIRKGPIDSIVLDPATVPSHHGPDVNTVLPHIPVVTMAVKVPVTHMHLHALFVTLREKDVRIDDVLETFEKTTRILLVRDADGISSTSQLIEFARDLGRPRSDLYEVCVWRESVNIVDDEVCFFQGIHQEADVVPENVDAIRAATRASKARESMDLTNKMLKILK